MAELMRNTVAVVASSEMAMVLRNEGDADFPELHMVGGFHLPRQDSPGMGRILSAALSSLAATTRIDWLVLFAPGPILAAVNRSLSPELGGRVLLRIADDLTTRSVPAIERRVRSALADIV
jgi:protein required for attachment to host cells